MDLSISSYKFLSDNKLPTLFYVVCMIFDNIIIIDVLDPFYKIYSVYCIYENRPEL